MENYVIIKVKFNFPEKVKYPSIPSYLDKSTTVYVRNGEALLTGAEYLLARYQGCEMELKEAICLPFYRHDKKKSFESIKRPFYDIIDNLQTLRRKEEKGSILNLLYKEMANSIYGNVVRGISLKKTFDIKTNTMVSLEAGELSNPILGSYTTALIRSIIGETLHNIDLLGGKVVSVTTDGFITDLENLETKLMSMTENSTKLLRYYREMRFRLSGVQESYELKNKGEGIISWATRGQLGINSEIKAATGFQTREYEKETLVGEFINVLGSDTQKIEFIEASLRGGNEIYKKGGHVMMKYNEKEFSLRYDNRRRILAENNNLDFSAQLLDSEPLEEIEDAKKYRSISEILSKRIYSQFITRSSDKSCKTILESAVRSFIKGLLAEKAMFGLEKYKKEFKTYNDLIKYLKQYDKIQKMCLTTKSISKLKNRKLVIKPVKRTTEVEDFVKFLKLELREFKEDEFFKTKGD